MKKLASRFIDIIAISIFSAGFILAGLEISDRLDEKYPPKPNPLIMQRIDEMQGLSPAMKENALRRLSKMGTDSVEIIIKKAGF